jgi:hypothetical protein
MKLKSIFFYTIIALSVAIIISVSILVAIDVRKDDSVNLAIPHADFIQPWVCEDWTVSDFESYMDDLSEARYNTIIFQYVRDDENIYYPQKNLNTMMDEINLDYNYIVDRLMTAAKNKGFKVFLGLSIETSWWGLNYGKTYKNAEYLNNLALLDNLIASELYELYKNDYPNTFIGWYWSWELYDNNMGFEDYWANMMNTTIDYLIGLDNRLPVMFSPFKSFMIPFNAKVSKDMWSNFLSQVHFRKGDIFVPQDSIGKICSAEAETEALNITRNYLFALKEAASVNSNVEMWVNCELFTSKSLFNDSELYTATLERVKEQFKIAREVTDHIITFSYSHFCIPDSANGNIENFHQDYINYLKELDDLKK